MKTKMRSDKRKNPTMIEYRILSNDECRNLSGHCLILDKNGDLANVKITSIKTWKTRSEFEVRCQFGLREFFTVKLDDDTPNTELVNIVELKENDDDDQTSVDYSKNAMNLE